MGILHAVFFFLRGLLFSRSALAAENLALRQQVAVYKQSVKRPKLRHRDRVFWVLLLSWFTSKYRTRTRTLGLRRPSRSPGPLDIRCEPYDHPCAPRASGGRPLH